MSEELRGYCGLDCRKCRAYIATRDDDDELRKDVAAEWSRLNGVEILPEMIDCEGCSCSGKKTIFAESICEIRKCARAKNHGTCRDCSDLGTCTIIRPLIDNNDEARAYLAR